jgi:hypothetical protein
LFSTSFKAHSALQDKVFRSPIDSGNLSIRDLLTHISVQCWPLPIPDYCVHPFCDYSIPDDEMEEHLRDDHHSATPYDYFSGMSNGNFMNFIFYILYYIGCPTEVWHLETYRLKPITTKMFILACPT